MSGITNLSLLLAGMQPTLSPEEFVYCSVSEANVDAYLPLRPLGLFREAEGVTLILPARVAAAHDIVHSTPMRCITLNVHSSLEAVGLTAAVSVALTREGISANVVAAYFHDHIFVPAGDAERAMAALWALTSTPTSDRGE
jgi:hypothetical protein